MAFEKIIGYEEIKVELNRVLDMIAHKEKYERLGAKLPRGILLQGDPGTGKTTIAKEFIDASGLKSFTLRKYKSDGEFLDEIAKVFSRAEEASIKYKETTIVFLDDMDK
ncbi:MAG: AAA family ATPase, partial [Erysipelotrichaceae bacterium]|nr:AAA family ATPase [Erysipelotrichaceae bacterium]